MHPVNKQIITILSMKGNNFVPPKVATPQSYFMMNVPLVDSITNQTKPNQIANTDFTSAINQAKINNLPSQKPIDRVPVIKPTLHNIHQPAFDKVKNFMQPSANLTTSDQASRTSIGPAPKKPQAPNFQQQVSNPLTPLAPQPKSSLRTINSMKQSSVKDFQSQSKKLTFTDNLVQQFQVQSWKRENMQNTFGYIPPSTTELKHQQTFDQRPATPPQNGIQTQIEGKQTSGGKKKTQPCCLLF